MNPHRHNPIVVLASFALGSIISLIILALIWFLVWCFSPRKPVTLHGYKAAWQPCAPVDTDYYYLDGAEGEEVGSIDNVVGCPIEISKYVAFSPIINHSKIKL